MLDLLINILAYYNNISLLYRLYHYTVCIMSTFLLFAYIISLKVYTYPQIIFIIYTYYQRTLSPWDTHQRNQF